MPALIEVSPSPAFMSAKVLTVRQPWAWLIVNGYKTIENRTWKSAYLGPIYIHAAKRMECPFAVLDWLRIQKLYLAHNQLEEAAVKGLKVGGIIGKVDVVGYARTADLLDGKPIQDSPWFTGPWGWILDRAKVLQFVACPGKLGLWNAAKVLRPRGDI